MNAPPSSPALAAGNTDEFGRSHLPPALSRRYSGSMFRALFVSLLIPGLLACPLRCTPALAVVQSDVAVMTASSSCCGPNAADAKCSTGDGFSGGESQPTEEDCECVNCICHGAVLESDADGSQVALRHVFDHRLAESLIDTGFGLDVSGTGRTDSFSSHGYFSTGRAARIAHQSLLI